MGRNRMGPKGPGGPEGQEAGLRSLPQVERLAASLPGSAPHASRVVAARDAIDEARASILSGGSVPTLEDLIAGASSILESQAARGLRAVVNATGVLLHTNLGRAPLGTEALNEIAATAADYSNLEYDAVSARRGSRYDHCVEALKGLTGAEDALVVNNNAAGVLLALRGMARDGEVVISRGELIEIGGGFRIPEVLAESGARLVEVGTTNRTNARDYVRAIGDGTAAIMKVHPSNYRVVGFTAEVPSKDLAKLAGEHSLAFIHDLGSGLLRRRIAGLEPEWLIDEPVASEAVAEGADLVTFSGDKLLGGPQCGIIVGRADAVSTLRRLPLLRALRVGKLTLAALSATLALYLDGREAQLPFWRMALAPADEIGDRARRVAGSLKDVHAKVEVSPGASTTGGGSAPGMGIPTFVIEIAPLASSVQEVFRRLVHSDPPIVGRISDDRLVLDLRTVPSDQDGAVEEGLRSSL